MEALQRDGPPKILIGWAATHNTFGPTNNWSQCSLILGLAS